MGLYGTHYVVPTSSAIREGLRVFPKVGELHEARKHVLKLAYWPGDGRKVMDLEWQWIKAHQALKIGELRIDDTIAGNDNLRAIFWVPGVALAGDPKRDDGEPMPRIWIMCVMQKKSDDFSSKDLTTFKARRTILVSRFYHGMM